LVRCGSASKKGEKNPEKGRVEGLARRLETYLFVASDAEAQEED
jgi:hypothetical protein